MTEDKKPTNHTFQVCARQNNNIKIVLETKYMIPVNVGYKQFVELLRQRYNERKKVFALLLLFRDEQDEKFDMLEHYGYYDEVSGDKIDFFCPGYSFEGEVRQDDREYGKFIKEFKNETSFQNEHGIQLLLLPYENGQIIYNHAYVCNITEMLEAGIIKNGNKFVEGIIDSMPNVNEYLTEMLCRNVGNTFIECVIKFLPKKLQNICNSILKLNRSAKYFTAKDISKKHNDEEDNDKKGNDKKD